MRDIAIFLSLVMLVMVATGVVIVVVSAVGLWRGKVIAQRTAAERRATVERIRARLVDVSVHLPVDRDFLERILDEASLP